MPIARRAEKLKDLFAQLPVTLEGEGLVEFNTVMQDGTKVRARASRSSFHRAASIRKRVLDKRGIEFLAPDIEDSQKGKGKLTRTGVSPEF